MAKTISSSYSSTITLVSTDNPVTVTNTGTINAASGDGLLGSAYFGWSVTNDGLIIGAQAGIDLKGTADVENHSTGTIAGTTYGVLIRAAAGTVGNAGTITGSGTHGIGVNLKYGGQVSNTATTALISGGYDGVYLGADGTVSNLGTITGTGSVGAGIDVGTTASGTIINGAAGTTASAANIYGSYYGIFASGAATVTNYGTIGAGAFPGDAGIMLQDGGQVINEQFATIAYGVVILGGTAPTIDNAGYIGGSRFGVVVSPFVSGATVINSGTIAGTSYAIEFFGTNDVLVDKPGAVFNGAVIAGSSDTLELASGASAGTLTGLGSSYSGFRTVAIDSGATWGVTGTFGGLFTNSGTLLTTTSLSLYGTVINAGSFQAPFYLGSGGYLSNQASGVIAGDASDALVAAGATVVNAGLISNTSTAANTFGVYIQDSGTLTNTNTGIIGGGYGGVGAQGGASPSIDNSGVITGSGDSGFGIGLQGSGTVTNSGTIAATGTSSDGIEFKLGGVVTNSSGGTISGMSLGVYIFGTGTASVSNAGLIEGTDTLVMADGVALSATTNILSNTGTIAGTGDAVDLFAGGTLVNAVSGARVGYILGVTSGVFVSDGAGSITNDGTIMATGTASVGVELTDGGILTNGATHATALIQGNYYGVLAYGQPTTLTNFGTIEGGKGVEFEDKGTPVGNTLINAGTILSASVGAPAVQFGAGNNLLILDPGATFGTDGLVEGGAGTNTLELASAASAGTLSGVVTSASAGYVGFSALIVDAGARWTLGGVNSVAGGTPITIGNGASLDVTGVLTGAASFSLGGGALELANAADPGATFDFGDNGSHVGPDELTLDSASGTSFGNAITGFSFLDKIVLPSVTFDTTSTPIIGANSVTIGLQGGGTFTFSDFAFQSGAPTTLTVGADFIQDAACYCRGTRILTPDGEVPIEVLAIGDLVLTLWGETKPIKWIGRRAYDGRFVAGNRTLQPILIRAGALDENVPHRDLYVSPQHAMFFDDVLVSAEKLVNGVSILRCDTAETLEYFHLELDAHDIIIAEGAAAETFADCDNRSMFHNAAEFTRLYPHDAAPTWTFCAPRVKDGDDLARIRRRLEERLAWFGYTTTTDPELRLVADGCSVAAEAVDGCVCRFRLAQPPTELRIVSRSSIPAEVRVASPDVRRLGVNLSRIILSSESVSLIVGHRDSSLVDGFHDAEASHRWTDGNARVPTKFLACFDAEFTMEVDLLDHALPYRSGACSEPKSVSGGTREIAPRDARARQA